MENNIKDEFKEFITALSTEICREVLLEELKQINKSFNTTEKEYRSLYKDYNENSNNIKNEFLQLRNINQKLGQFVQNVDSNNKDINKALKLINGEYKIVTDNIIKRNDELFKEFSIKVRSLNESERNEFITTLISSIDSSNKKHITELKNIVNDIEINRIQNSLNSLSTKTNKLGSSTKNIINKFDDLEEIILDLFEDKFSQSERVLMCEINKVNDRLVEISNNIDKKNKIMMASVVVILMFIKFLN